jgi:hypothetical protein
MDQDGSTGSVHNCQLKQQASFPSVFDQLDPKSMTMESDGATGHIFKTMVTDTRQLRVWQDVMDGEAVWSRIMIYDTSNTDVTAPRPFFDVVKMESNAYLQPDSFSIEFPSVCSEKEISGLRPDHYASVQQREYREQVRLVLDANAQKEYPTSLEDGAPVNCSSGGRRLLSSESVMESLLEDLPEETRRELQARQRHLLGCNDWAFPGKSSPLYIQFAQCDGDSLGSVGIHAQGKPHPIVAMQGDITGTVKNFLSNPEFVSISGCIDSQITLTSYCEKQKGSMCQYATVNLPSLCAKITKEQATIGIYHEMKLGFDWVASAELTWHLEYRFFKPAGLDMSAEVHAQVFYGVFYDETFGPWEKFISTDW